MESKVFEIGIEERKGKPQVIIVESKRGVSSWVRMGPTSVGFCLEGLNQCIKDGKEGKWERGWKEKGRSYSLVQDANSAGCFLRLRVVDLEKKRYNICILKGRGERLYGRDVTKAGCKFCQKREKTGRKGHGKVVCGNGEEAEEQEQ